MKLTDKTIKSLCSSTIYKRGMEYFKQGRVHIKTRDDDKLTAVVDGEAVYNVQIKMSDEKIEDCYCSCPYFYTMNTACKHIAATLLLRRDEIENNGGSLTDVNERLASRLCAAYGLKNAEKIGLHLKFEISVLCRSSLEREFSVKLFAEEKNIEYPENFLDCIKNGKSFKISKNIEYIPEKTIFDSYENAMLSILTESYEGRTAQAVSYTKSYGSVSVGEEAMKRIFEILPNCRYTIVFNRMNIGKIPIKKENPDILIDISAAEGEITLYSGSYGTALSSDGKIFFFDDCIYITDKEWRERFMPIYEALAEDSRTQLSFKGDNAIAFASVVLPELSSLKGVITNGIEAAVIKESPKMTVYLDYDGNEILCTVKASYGDISLLLPEAVHNRRKIIVRDFQTENKILDFISDFEYKNGYYRLSDDEKIFNFFKSYKELEKYAVPVPSDRFCKAYVRDNIGIGASVSYNRDSGLFEASLETELSYEQIRDILSAVKLKKSFYKLPDGGFADLTAEGEMLFSLIKSGFSAEDVLNEKKILPNYRLLYLNALAESGINSKISVGNDIKEFINEQKSKTAVLPKGLEAILRDYQKAGVNWFKQLSSLGAGGILADDMGLGKTLQALAFLYSEKSAKPVLIITPSSLTYNWKNEMNKFIPEASVMLINGDSSEREALIEKIPEFEFVITSYPLLRRDIEQYKAIEFSYCIIDEAQNIKNPRTLNATAVKKINAERRFALTGTPIENSLSELWSVFDFIMPGYLNSNRQFKEWYEIPITKNNDSYALEELKAKISPFILRRMKKDVLSELPEKIESTVFADLTEEQKNLYTAYSHAAKDETLAILADGRPKLEILTLLTRLRQISCHPALFDENYNGGSGKLEVLTELVTTSVASKHRILIFSQFTSMLDIIQKQLKSKGFDLFRLDGSTASERRIELAERFNSGEREIFLISLKAGGFGLNLTGADTVIHFDPWWNPAVTAQASDRVYRIGQNKNVQIIQLASKNTVEEKILQLSEGKKKLASEIINGNSSVLGSMSAEEILSLFD